MKIFDEFIGTSAKLADQAAKVAGEVMDKGKKRVTKLALENDLAKAQRQLGALVYVMHKTGEHNEELLAQYIDDVAKLEEQIENFKVEETDEFETSNLKVCNVCCCTVSTDDKFCRGCGNKIEE